jgi:hypothetical protein
MRHLGVSPHPLLAFLPLQILILFDPFRLSPRLYFILLPSLLPPLFLPTVVGVSIVCGYEKTSVNTYDQLYSIC